MSVYRSRFSAKNMKRILTRFGKWVTIGGLAGVILASPYALYYGVLAGTFFGAWGAYFTAAAPIGVPLGIIWGLVLGVGMVSIFAALLGGSVGLLLERMIHKP